MVCAPVPHSSGRPVLFSLSYSAHRVVFIRAAAAPERLVPLLHYPPQVFSTEFVPRIPEAQEVFQLLLGLPVALVVVAFLAG